MATIFFEKFRTKNNDENPEVRFYYFQSCGAK